MPKPPNAVAQAPAPARSIVPDASPAKVIANYRIDRTIGQGTYGKVKLGIHLVTGEKAAVKIIEKSQIKSPKQVARLQREIRFLKLLHHPHIISVYDVIETDAYIYILTEYAVGGELFDYIVSNKRIAEDEARRFFRMVVGAVAYCHQNAVIHRDLKPENLLLDENKSIKIIDFGFANNYKTDGSQLDTFCGSPFYAAPEMILGKKYTGPEVDIWSLGVILFAMLCGHLPFDVNGVSAVRSSNDSFFFLQDDNMKELYRKIASGKYAVPDHVSPTARHLMSRLIHTHPQTRATMRELLMHPWINSGYAYSVSAHIPARPAMGEPVTLDAGIVARLEAFGHKRESVEEAFARRQSRGRDRQHFETDGKVDDDDGGDDDGDGAADDAVLADGEEDVCATYFLVVEMLAREDRRRRAAAAARDAKRWWAAGTVGGAPTRDSVATCVELEDVGAGPGADIPASGATKNNISAASSADSNSSTSKPRPWYLPAPSTGQQPPSPPVLALHSQQTHSSQQSPRRTSQNNSQSQLPIGKQPASSIRDFLLGKFLASGKPAAGTNENDENLNTETIKRKPHHDHDQTIRRRARRQLICKSIIYSTFTNATHSLTQLLNKSQQGVLRFWSVNPFSEEVPGVSIFSIECEMDALQFQTEPSQLCKEQPATQPISTPPGENKRSKVIQAWVTDVIAQSRNTNDSTSSNYGDLTEDDTNALTAGVSDLRLAAGRREDPAVGGSRESSRSTGRGTDDISSSEGRKRIVSFHIEIVSRENSKECEVRFFAVAGDVAHIKKCAERLVWKLKEARKR
ncbi:hypothetical protein HDU84_004046 [Entophlyctis sp. JEL0112]|nr:hypothetical protein HDU84_004046 [Entophlyctis sp. JEL0112]